MSFGPLSQNFRVAKPFIMAFAVGKTNREKRIFASNPATRPTSPFSLNKHSKIDVVMWSWNAGENFSRVLDRIDQVFHLILCSNYEAGVRATRDFYSSRTNNPKYSPNNRSALRRFKGLHPELWEGITGNRRPLQWLVLWKIIREHEGGVCDRGCMDLRRVESDARRRQLLLDWLEENEYLSRFDIENAWESSENRYIVNWTIIRRRLGVEPPPPLTPLSPEDVE